jgi:uroporphyrin-III C-methyltransferase/precorrin-2 dehydrogenase/sirohydrochlorin ferrochelatase
MRKRADKHSLTVTLRLADRPVILVGEGPMAETQRRLIERAGGRIVGEGSKAALAIVIDDAAAVSRLKVRGVLVCAIDQSELSDFIMPGKAGENSALGKLAALLARPLLAIRTLLPGRRGDAISLDLVLARGGPLEDAEAVVQAGHADARHPDSGATAR